ncbi:MAG: hypothetical protein ACYTG0_35410 [Planctomycetota bacterium]|jgi:hypothetical protein
MSEPRKCKSETCKTKIAFAYSGAAGAKVPLDLSAPVYEITGFDKYGELICRRANSVGGPRIGEFYVTHFATCKDAISFSRRKT